MLRNWSVPYQIDEETGSETDEQPHTFTQAYPPAVIQTVYGYMVTSPFPHLLWAERLAAPLPMMGSGQYLTVRPSLTLINQP